MSDQPIVAPENAMPAVPAAPVQTDNDDTLIDLWLHGKAAHTRRAYAGDVQEFLA